MCKACEEIEPTPAMQELFEGLCTVTIDYIQANPTALTNLDVLKVAHKFLQSAENVLAASVLKSLLGETAN